MVSIVRAATCGRVLSWRNDTDVCALFLLFLMAVVNWTFEKRRVIFTVYFATHSEEIHVQYTFRVPEDGGHNLPSTERGFWFFGFRRPWVMPLHWRTFALGREVMHPHLICCHDRIQKKPPFCLYHDNNDCATCSCVLLCSSFNKRGVHRGHTFEYWRCCLMIAFTLPSLMFSIVDNLQAVIHLFSQMSALTWSLFLPVMEVLSQCSWGSFSTVFLPFLNALLHLEIPTFDIVLSPYCLFNLLQISDGLRPTFLRNLIIMRCFMLTCTFASLIFLTTDKTAQ